LCLQEAQKIGILQVMMTCEQNNEDTYRIIKKVMLKMGGREIISSQQNNNSNHRIWIETKERHCGKIRTLVLAIIQKNGKILVNKGYDDKKMNIFTVYLVVA